jgi:hypothetical protein
MTSARHLEPTAPDETTYRLSKIPLPVDDALRAAMEVPPEKPRKLKKPKKNKSG